MGKKKNIMNILQIILWGNQEMCLLLLLSIGYLFHSFLTFSLYSKTINPRKQSLCWDEIMKLQDIAFWICFYFRKIYKVGQIGRGWGQSYKNVPSFMYFITQWSPSLLISLSRVVKESNRLGRDLIRCLQLQTLRLYKWKQTDYKFAQMNLPEDSSCTNDCQEKVNTKYIFFIL